MQITYNSTVLAHPAISSHWRKFKRWAQDTVLHGNSDRSRLSKEFTTARQRLSEDPNQFYIRLFNLGIQSGRTVDTEDYRTRLVSPLLKLIEQQDRTYHTIQDLIAHAGRLWQTLTLERMKREIREEKEEKERTNRYRQQQSDRPNRDRDQARQLDASPRGQQRNRNERSTRLSTEESQHRRDNRLCFNCGYLGHRKKECKHAFRPNRAPLRDDKAKVQPARGQKRPHVRAQPTYTNDDDDNVKRDTYTTDEEFDQGFERAKRLKND